MTQDTDTPTLGEQAARMAEQLEDWEPTGEDRLMEDFAATGMGAEVGTNGAVRDAWIVLQPGSPRMEFSAIGSGDGGALTLYDNGDRHRTHVNPCPAVDRARELLRLQYDGAQVQI